MIDLKKYGEELSAELENILQYWMHYTVDTIHGGFYGHVNYDNTPHTTAAKGSVLNARILWTFSAAYRCTKNADYLYYAHRAYDYFIEYFIDPTFGGVYWSVDFAGSPADTKKQVYAQGFAIYALSEFYLATGTVAAKEHAIDLFALIERHSYDKLNTGYMDAFSGDWQPMDDMRLSEKDANEKKTMNTHLHILEGYSNLFRIWPDELLNKKIKGLLLNFTSYIIDEKTNHLVLFFDEDWNRRSTIVSYGHDIEAAWLLQEAAEIINDAALIQKGKQNAVAMVDAAKEGLDADAGLWYEYEPARLHLIKEKHWWPQAEAMVGFFNAWQVSGNNEYLQQSLNSWSFTKQYICDAIGGEWAWGVKEDYTIMQTQGKAGIWKCPYHNGRACIEIIKRIEKTVTQ